MSERRNAAWDEETRQLNEEIAEFWRGTVADLNRFVDESKERLESVQMQRARLEEIREAAVLAVQQAELEKLQAAQILVQMRYGSNGGQSSDSGREQSQTNPSVQPSASSAEQTEATPQEEGRLSPRHRQLMEMMDNAPEEATSEEMECCSESTLSDRENAQETFR